MLRLPPQLPSVRALLNTYLVQSGHTRLCGMDAVPRSRPRRTCVPLGVYQQIDVEVVLVTAFRLSHPGVVEAAPSLVVATVTVWELFLGPICS